MACPLIRLLKNPWILFRDFLFIKWIPVFQFYNGNYFIKLYLLRNFGLGNLDHTFRVIEIDIPKILRSLQPFNTMDSLRFGV
jgi:hypothetical protein